MRLAISSSHRDYFQKENFIEFEDLLSPNHITSFIEGCKKYCFLVSPEEVFMKGHDLFRKDASLKKIICHPQLAKIAVELTERPSVRIGQDQLILTTKQKAYFSHSPNAFTSLLKQSLSLNQSVSLNGIACGLLLCLERTSISTPGLPTKAGNGLFISPSYPLPFDHLYASEDGLYLLITYAERKATYSPQEVDPHLFSLKKYGYKEGSFLNQKFNPIIYTL